VCWHPTTGGTVEQAETTHLLTSLLLFEYQCTTGCVTRDHKGITTNHISCTQSKQLEALDFFVQMQQKNAQCVERVKITNAPYGLVWTPANPRERIGRGLLGFS
jgi:hypothetical protein